MQWSWLVNPLAGSIIGYGTNYLAIKMLFKPHNAKYIGRMKIPFTPGLIPKEKDTLARQIGETVEEHLLNEDVLVETLTSTKVKEAFFVLMAKLAINIEKNNITIDDMVKRLLTKGLEESLLEVEEQLILEFVALLGSREIMDPTISHLTDDLVPQIETVSKTILKQAEVREYLYKGLTDLETKIYQMIESHADDIGKNIITSISQGQDVNEMKDSIMHWAQEHFNPMVLMFLNIDKIFDSIVEYAYNALDDPGKKEKFSKLLCKIVNDVLHEPTSFIFEEEDQTPDYKNKVITMIESQINQENIQLLLQATQEEFDGDTDDFQTQIRSYLYQKWEGFIRTEVFLDLGKKILRKLANRIGKIPLNNFSRLISAKNYEEIREQIFELYRQAIRNNSKTIVEVMDISSLVEEKINQFSSQEAEEIILSVVKNQLRGITWIGALLGFIIGMIPNLIS